MKSNLGRTEVEQRKVPRLRYLPIKHIKQHDMFLLET